MKIQNVISTIVFTIILGKLKAEPLTLKQIKDLIGKIGAEPGIIKLLLNEGIEKIFEKEIRTLKETIILLEILALLEKKIKDLPPMKEEIATMQELAEKLAKGKAIKLAPEIILAEPIETTIERILGIISKKEREKNYFKTERNLASANGIAWTSERPEISNTVKHDNGEQRKIIIM